MKNLDDIFPAEFVEQRNKQYELADLQKKEASYWDFLGELMFFGGFELVKAVMDDYIELEQAQALLNSVRRVHNGVIYSHARAAFAGAAGVYKSTYFDEIIKDYKKDMI